MYVDVDGTLVIVYADYMEKDQPQGVEPIMSVDDSKFYPHKIHIDMVKEFKHRGFNIIVWSQGGSDWAESVVKKIGLEDYIDVIMPKPSWYFDDAPVEKFMPENTRIYKAPLGSNGNTDDSLPSLVPKELTDNQLSVDLAKQMLGTDPNKLVKQILGAKEIATIDLAVKGHEDVPRDPDWHKPNNAFHAILKDMNTDRHSDWVLGYLWKNYEVKSKTKLTPKQYRDLVTKFKKFQKLTTEQQTAAREKYANVYAAEQRRREQIRQREASDSSSGANLCEGHS